MRKAETGWREIEGRASRRRESEPVGLGAVEEVVEADLGELQPEGMTIVEAGEVAEVHQAVELLEAGVVPWWSRKGSQPSRVRAELA
ncbi:MAG TPA: hypothetical protein VE685_09480 [Thermoanaerobaculia bacterium]|nr:hypothetical protein [Thermoanaerobaculia bacterium]